MHFSELARITGLSSRISADCEVTFFSTDSRSLTGVGNEVFIAAKGSRDGHDFVMAAYDKGIRNFILERDMELADANVLLAPNSIRAFQQIASHHRKQFDIPVIGITGSNGKTTVKEWLSTLVSQKLFVF